MANPGDRFRSRLREPRPIVLDGAIGSELHRRGVDTRLPLWSAWALMEAPQVVARLHREHALAGAEVVTANTFRTQPRTLARAGLGGRARVLVQLAVKLARSSGAPFVAGSMAPLEDCYSPELVPSPRECEAEHAEHAAELAAAGCDLLQVETMNTVREAAAAARAALATGLPTVVGLVCRSDGRLFSGERVADAARALLTLGVDALVINCTPAPTIHQPFMELVATIGRRVPCGLYANIGRTDAIQGWTCTEEVTPAQYARLARRWLALGARLVGGCCGTTAAHVAALAAIVRRVTAAGSARRRPAGPAAA